MARPAQYPTPEDRDLVTRNPDAEAVSERLRQHTLDRIDRGETGPIVEDPLGALIEEARASS